VIPVRRRHVGDLGDSGDIDDSPKHRPGALLDVAV